MRVAVIAMVKNEADVIESFIRYNSAFADVFGICDYGSTDNTVEILQSLIREGVKINLSEDCAPEHDLGRMKARLLQSVVSESDADWIVPLDADEFLIADSGGNPRRILESLNREKVHLAALETYVPTASDDENEPFVPRRILNRLAREPKPVKKAIVPRIAASHDGVRLAQGYHDLHEPNSVKQEDCTELRIARFPIRSIEQAVSKFTEARLNDLAGHERPQGNESRWRDGYETIRQYPSLDKNRVYEFMRRGSAGRNETCGELVRDPIDSSFVAPAKIHSPKLSDLGAYEKLAIHAESLAAEVARLTGQVNRLKQQLADAHVNPGGFNATSVYRNMLTVPRFTLWDSAWTEHLPFAFVLTSLLEPRLLVELGVHTGNSFLAFCQKVQEEGLRTSCYGVDTWQGDNHTGQYPERIYQDLLKRIKSHHYDRFATLLRMDFDEAATHFSDHSIDLIHIDGLHTYEAVKHDFETWLPKASNRAVMLFHDVEARHMDFGAWKLWEEVQSRFLSYKFRFGSGLGVLVVGDKVPEGVKALVSELNTNARLVELFGMSGQQLTQVSLSKQQAVDLDELRDSFWMMGGRFGLRFANFIRRQRALFVPLQRAVKLARRVKYAIS